VIAEPEEQLGDLDIPLNVDSSNSAFHIVQWPRTRQEAEDEA
jgi:hypothetical protein